MKITDWIIQQWRERREPDKAELNGLSQQLDRACALNDFDTLAALLRKYRHSEFVTKLIGARMIRGGYPMICTPNDVIRDDVLKMMESLRDTQSVRRSGSTLAAISAEAYNPLYDLLAMHTFMLDIYSKQHPHGWKSEYPPLSEVQAATRLLDQWHKADYVRELTDLIFHHEYPSEYLALRFGWEKEYQHARHLETQSEMPCDENSFDERQMLHDDRELLYAGWEKKAEQVLETLPGITLPERYAIKLNAELEQLVAFVRCPELAAAPNADRGLLFKYGIEKDAPQGVRNQQVGRAFQELDARLVHLPGRRPRAGEPCAQLKPHDSQLMIGGRETPSRRRICRNPLKKGCKHSL